MRWITKHRKQRLGALAAAIAVTAWMPNAMAMTGSGLPEGLHDEDGVSIIASNENNHMELNVTKDKAVANWNDFSIDKDHSVNFHRESGGSWQVLNRVTGSNLSEINGKLTGDTNGTIFLINPHGITFGNGAEVNVGSLVASTLDITNKNFMADKYVFEGNGGTITNLANINAANDGVVVLLAQQVFNGIGKDDEGKDIKVDNAINAGQVAMAAGKQITLGNLFKKKSRDKNGNMIISYDDKIGVKINYALDNNDMVINTGTINANLGYVTMMAKEAKNLPGYIICNQGIVKAQKMVLNEDGTVSLTDEGEGCHILLQGGNVNVGGQLLADGKIGGTVDIKGNSTITGLVSANGSKGDGGTINANGDTIMLAGTLSADGKNGGTINTTATNNVLVFDQMKVNELNLDAGAHVHAKATGNDAEKKVGTWNITAANVTVENDIKHIDGENTSTVTSDTDQKVSANVLSDTLIDTNVNIIAKPTAAANPSDIIVKGPVKKIGTESTSLTMTAGRNISVDADITSTAGKLNLILNSNDELSGESARIDGASIIRANINTNGGDFSTTGRNGTYFGLKDSENAGDNRTVKTNGGNITLNGEVLLATGGKVTLDTTAADGRTAGDVTITGTVDSGNKYTIGKVSDIIPWDEKSGQLHKDETSSDGHQVTLEGAKEDAEKQGGYLAVITSGLEDAIVNSVVPVGAESHIGGHVVAMPEGVTCTVDEKGNIELKGLTEDGKIPDGKLQLLYTDTTYGENSYKVREGNGNRGWYKVNDNTLVRLWAWVTGPEAGKVFYVQAIQSTGDKINPSQGNYKQLKHFGKAYGYTNFLANEPNDDLIQQNTQNALAINYHSQWDDIYEDTHDVSDHVKTYVVETELGHTSLEIDGNQVDLQKDVGGITRLNDLNINSKADINATGLLQVDNDVVAKAVGSLTVGKSIDAKNGSVELEAGSGSKAAGEIIAGHNIITNGVTAGNTVSMVADNNITINGVVKSQATNSQAVEIVAQGNFYNKTTPVISPQSTKLLMKTTSSVGTQEPAIQVANGGAWKVYANNPETSELGDLNSENFAVWSWGKPGFQYNADTDSKNRFIFKATPEVVYTANDKTKAADAEMPALDYGESYMLNGTSLLGKYTANFKDGNIDELKSNYGLDKVEASLKDGVTPNVKGVYENGIELKNTANAKGNMENLGYKMAFNPGTLTVTDAINPQPEPNPNPKPGEVKPQLDPHDTTNVDGSASYTTAPQQAGPGADRVLGLQSAELPFFREENGQTKLYGTYDVSIDPDKVKMEPTAKVLPEPDQPKNQYREYDKEITTKVGTAKFKLTYNGSTFDIYPVDIFGKKVLKAGDAAKNVEVESQALFAAFKEMGITLDDLDGVYTHFDNRKEVQSFRK